MAAGEPPAQSGRGGARGGRGEKWSGGRCWLLERALNAGGNCGSGAGAGAGAAGAGGGGIRAAALRAEQLRGDQARAAAAVGSGAGAVRRVVSGVARGISGVQDRQEAGGYRAAGRGRSARRRGELPGGPGEAAEHVRRGVPGPGDRPAGGPGASGGPGAAGAHQPAGASGVLLPQGAPHQAQAAQAAVTGGAAAAPVPQREPVRPGGGGRRGGTQGENTRLRREGWRTDSKKPQGDGEGLARDADAAAKAAVFVPKQEELPAQLRQPGDGGGGGHGRASGQEPGGGEGADLPAADAAGHRVQRVRLLRGGGQRARAGPRPGGRPDRPVRRGPADEPCKLPRP